VQCKEICFLDLLFLKVVHVLAGWQRVVLVSNIQAATLYCERCKTDFHFISLNKKEIDLVEYT